MVTQCVWIVFVNGLISVSLNDPFLIALHADRRFRHFLRRLSS